MLEVYKAIDLGYTVIEISEVWDYGQQTMRYKHGQEEKTGLFTSYINTFLKMKQEASDWPKWCRTEEDRNEYITDYMEHEGIELNETNITKNPALRALAKLCLNSFFGKFGQRDNMPKDDHITDPKEFHELLRDASKHVNWVRPINQEKIHVNYEHEEGFEESLPSTNVIIAAYVTTQARLKLYSYLEQLQKDVLYMDTDSIVYVKHPQTPIIPTGSHLGDMMNELEDYGPNAYIDEFVSVGAKNYAFKVVNCEDNRTHTTVKIRGFTLDSIMAKRLNMNTLKNKVKYYVKDGFHDTTTVVIFKIQRTANNHVLTVPQRRTYSIVIDKRWCADNYTTYPYGYLL